MYLIKCIHNLCDVFPHDDDEYKNHRSNTWSCNKYTIEMKNKSDLLFSKSIAESPEYCWFRNVLNIEYHIVFGMWLETKAREQKKNLKSNEIFQFPWNHFPCIVSMSTISSFCCLRCEAVIRRITCSTKFSAIYVFLALTTFSSSLKLCNIPGHLCSAIWRYER